MMLGHISNTALQIKCFECLEHELADLMQVDGKIFLYSTGVLSLVGNGMLLFVAYRKRLCLKPAEFFIVNLSVSDLGMTLSLFPLAIPSALAHR